MIEVKSSKKKSAHPSWKRPPDTRSLTPTAARLAAASCDLVAPRSVIGRCSSGSGRRAAVIDAARSPRATAARRRSSWTASHGRRKIDGTSASGKTIAYRRAAIPRRAVM